LNWSQPMNTFGHTICELAGIV